MEEIRWYINTPTSIQGIREKMVPPSFIQFGKMGGRFLLMGIRKGKKKNMGCLYGCWWEWKQ